MDHKLGPVSMKRRQALVVGIVAIMVLGFASLQAVTAGNSSKPPAAPVHVSHPMEPFVSPGASTPASPPISCPEASGQCLVDINWAGYSVCGLSPSVCSSCLTPPFSPCAISQGDVTDVQGTWIVPTITSARGQSCSDDQNTWYDASDWVGIDGLITPSVEQTGTSADCFYGQAQYYAWYEFYPQPSFTINIPVNPGDRITASVGCLDTAGTITCSLSLKDDTNKQSFTTSTSVSDSSCASTGTYCLASAEWIEEDACYDGFLALTPVTPVLFTNNFATIGGQTHHLSGWGPLLWGLTTATFQYPTGVPADQAQTTVKSEESALSFGDTFSVRFYSSGP